MKFELDNYNRDFTNEDLINDLKRVAQILKKETFTHKEYKEHGKFSAPTIVRYLGSWKEALKKAGLQVSRDYNISDEEWFQNLENVWITKGRQPRPSDIEPPLSKYSYAGYKRKFGGWRKALEAFIEYINQEDTTSIEIRSSISTKDNGHETNRNINLRLRFIVMKRDNFKCKICGKSPASDPTIKLEVDHIVPWSRGGETLLENLQTLCYDCNRGKSDIRMDE